MFVVESEGVLEEDPVEEENKLAQFLDYITTHKVVMLEDLANEFGMMTKDVVDRIKRLEEQGRLLGVVDERGKYIHVTE